MIVEPPLLAGPVQLTVACAFPAVALRAVGAPGAVGTAVGVTEFDELLAGPDPALFVAVTVNVYDVPLLNPITVHDNAPAVHPQAAPPGLAVTV